MWHKWYLFSSLDQLVRYREFLEMIRVKIGKQFSEVRKKRETNVRNPVLVKKTAFSFFYEMLAFITEGKKFNGYNQNMHK